MVVGARTDQEIHQDLSDQLAWDARVDATEIKIMVSNGRVVLAGTVPTYMVRQVAEEDAGAIAGVQSVRNNLAVKYPRPNRLPTDQELKTRIESLLDWQPDVELTGLNISVRGGWVTLRGRVDVPWQKSRIQRLVLYVGGIVGVDNQIAVTPPDPPRDDEATEQLVRMVLQRNARFAAERIGVNVDEGVVTLTGTVPTLSALGQVRQTLETVAGVVTIEDEMSLD